jgi:membrane associated rhomboid family serine protease
MSDLEVVEETGSEEMAPDYAAAIADRAWEIRFASMLSRKAPLTRILVFVLVGVHLVISLYAQEAWLGAGAGDGMADFATLSLVGGNENVLVAHGEWWRLISAVFLHAGLLHLLFNAMAVHYLGQIVENALGPASFLLLFLLGGWFASLCSHQLTVAMSVGASGAVFALLGAAASYGVVNRRRIPKRLKRFLVVTPLIFIGLNMILTFVIPNIDVAAHGGGLVVGLVVTPLLGDKILLKRPRIPALLLRFLVVGTTALSMAALAFFMVPRFLGNPDRANVYTTLTTHDFGGQDVVVPEGWRCIISGRSQLRVSEDPRIENQVSQTTGVLVCLGPYATELQVQILDERALDDRSRPESAVGRDWLPIQILNAETGVNVPPGRAGLGTINRSAGVLYRLVTYETLMKRFYPLMEELRAARP